MSKKFLLLVSIMMIFVIALTSCQPAEDSTGDTAEESAYPTEDITIRLWTKEGEADGGYQFVTSLTDAYTEMHSNITFEVVNKEVETLREDFQTSSLGGDPPELLWTVNDHAGPFTAAGLIQSVEDLFDMSLYVPSVELDGHTWAVPITSGNHLMLLYNKDLVTDPPETTDELIELGQELTTADTYGLVYNQTEPFFMAPWLGGFDGAVFAEDGVTPTLDTPEMIAALQFLYDIKYTTPFVPVESDYDGADTLFKEGKAAMLINGDWSINGYAEEMGDKLGIASIPKVSETGLWPAPYTSGTYFMIPDGLEGDKLTVVVDFIKFATNEENQIKMIEERTVLPGLLSALESDLITNDELLTGSAEQMSKGTPMPSVLEMRCIWDAWKPEMQAVLADTKTPEDAAEAMQSAAELCIEDL